MEEDSETADLVLVLGTSLGGLYADEVATHTAARTCDAGGGDDGPLGAVCVNLQQTEQDGKMSLRLFATTDETLAMLLAELGYGRGNPTRNLPLLVMSRSCLRDCCV